MTLVDASVWIQHFRAPEPLLVEALLKERVLCHPLVLGEVASGNLRRRSEVLDRSEVLELMSNLPMAPVVSHDEALHFLERHRLMGKGLGWIDIQLLASAYMIRASLWSRDRVLAAAAAGLHLARL